MLARLDSDETLEKSASPVKKRESQKFFDKIKKAKKNVANN